MKKLLTALTVLLLTGAMASAQNSSCHFGIQAGVPFSKMNFKEFESSIKSRAGFNVGASLLIKLPLYFSIQPSVLYEQSILNVPSAVSVAVEEQPAVKQNMLVVPLSIQWGPDLGLLRPFVQVVPFAAYNFTINPIGNISNIEQLRQCVNKFQYGIGAGGGLDIWRIQISLRYNWGLGLWADVKQTQTWAGMWQNVKDGKCNSFTVSLAYFF